MTIFIAHAEADRAAAEALERHLERRGQFVELETGERGFRPLQSADSVVLLVSKDSVFSPWRLRWEARALEAWADGKLVVVKLDHAFSPVGLRDLPFIDASFEAQRDPFTWSKVADAIRALNAPAPPAGEVLARTPPPAAAPPPVSASPTPRARRAGPPWWVWLIAAVALALLGLVSGATFLVGSPAPSSGDILASVAGSASLALLAIGALAVLAAVVVAASALARRARSRAPAKRAAEPKPAPAPPEAAAPAPQAPAGTANVFVSYASVDRAKVVPIVDGVKQNGQTVWIDQQEIAAGEGWAGEIVRAIKGSKGVLVMCSAAAFESDHVKRELYLADRYKKRLLPVFLEDASPPEDFEYFFAGVQWLRLHDTPEADRSKAVVQALGAA